MSTLRVPAEATRPASGARSAPPSTSAFQCAPTNATMTLPGSTSGRESNGWMVDAKVRNASNVGAKINPFISRHAFEMSPFVGCRRRRRSNRGFLIRTQISHPYPSEYPTSPPSCSRAGARPWRRLSRHGAAVPFGEPGRNVGQTCARSAVSAERIALPGGAHVGHRLD
jgi:hypothetical protein